MTYHKTTAFWPRAAPGFQVFPSFSEKFQIQTQCVCGGGGAAKKTTPCLGVRQKQRHVDSSPPAAHLLGTIPPSVPHLRGKKSKIHLGKHAALCPKCFLWVSRCPPASPPCHLVSAASSLLTPLLSEPKLSWGPTPPWCHIQPPPALGAAQPSTQPQSWASLGAEILAPHLPALSFNDAEQNGNGEYRGGKLHLICFKSTEALIFWDVFLLYIFVNAKCSRCQIRLICKWKPILPSPPYSS